MARNDSANDMMANDQDMAAMRDSSPSFLLKCKASFVMNGIISFLLIFNLSMLSHLGTLAGLSFLSSNCLINVIGKYALISYILLLTILPCGSWGCEHNDGATWRTFSKYYFLPGPVMRSYFHFKFGNIPEEFIKEEAMPGAQFILAAFPHGCGAEYRVLMDGCWDKIMPNIVGKHANLRTLAASVLFNIPILREMCLWTSCINASRKTAERALDRGRTLLVLPGGEAEQIMTSYEKELVYLSERKGFIKLTMRKRTSVVPMYIFGCSDYFYTSTLLYGIRYKLMKNLGICIPFCAGLFGSPACPLPKRTTAVFGKPLKFEMKGDEPTSDELDKAHALFTIELVALFDEHKGSLGYGDRELKVI